MALTGARVKELRVLTELASLLHEKGHAVLSGESKLSLTTQSIVLLNQALEAVGEGRSDDRAPKLRQNPRLDQLRKDVMFLREFLQKTNSVKIIHRSGTIQGAVQITYFNTLQKLEIKKVPIHLIEGLHQLRSRLKSITCTRCIPVLQRPLCVLICLQLTSNQRAELPPSRAELPLYINPLEAALHAAWMLLTREQMDGIIRDLFETCGGDMASPMSWVQLNEACLSYNSIVSLDSSLRLLPALEILDVSHNCLERLENHLQYLTELVHINLGYNQVSVVPQFSLSVRTKLKTLILRNNRLEQLEGVEDLVNLEELDVTNNCLSDHSVLDVLHMLDNLSLLCLLGNPLSYHRSHRALSVQHVSPVAARSKFILDGKKLTEAEKMLTVNSRVHRSPSRRPTQVAHSLISDSQQITNKFTFSDSDAIATSLPVNAAGKKRTKAKAKIRSRKALIAEFESSTDTTTGVSDSSPAPSPMLHRRVMPHPQATTSNKEEFEVMREHYGSDWLRAFNSNPREEVKSEPSTSVEKPSALTEDDIFLNDSCTGLNSLDPGSSGTEKEDVVKNNDTGTEEESLFTKTTSSQDETCQVLARESSEHGMEWKRTDSEQHEYYGVESEPFIVILPDDTHLFLSFNDRYLLEKDMNGAVLEMLDLKLLESVGSAENGQEVTEGAEPVLLPTVRLTFGYVRRDRRERTYVMEDQANAEELENLLKPRLEAKMQLEKLKQQLQCLKCSSQFLKSEAKMGGREGRKPKGDAVLSSSLGDKPTDLGEGYHCPTCGSEMVVEMSVPMRDLQPASPIPVGSLPTTLTLPPQSCSTPQKPNNPQTPHSNCLVNGLKELSPRPAPLIGSLENVILAQKVGNRKRASLPAVLPPASASHLWKPQGETRAATSGISVARISEVPEGGESSNECLQNSFSDIERAEGKASNVSDFRLRQNSTGSDIAILCNPSEGVLNVLKEAGDEEKGGRTAVQTVSPVIERSVSLDANNVSASPQNNIALSDPRVTEEPAPTPLSVNVCNSMVSSVYENSINALPPQSDLGSDTVTCNGSIDTGIHGVSDEVDADISIYDNPSKAANRETQVTQAAESDDSVLAGTEVTTGSSVTCVSVPSASTNGHLPEDQTNPVCDNTCRTNSSNRDEFAVTDHMLKLHFHMSVLKESEECICMLQCGVVQYMVQEEFEGILLLATENIYILKILPDIRKKKGTEPTAWLKCIEAQPLSELEYIDMGFGKQSFRLEFNTDCSSYSFLVCDLERCQAFVHLFRASLQELDHKTIPGEDVDRATVGNLFEQVFTEAERRAGNDLLEASDICSHDIYYVKGQLLEDGKRRSVGVVVNEWDMYLVTENHQWPLPRLQAPLSEDMRGQQFTLIVRQHINNILQIQLFKDKSNEVSIMFCDEEKGEESEWRITMATPRCVSSLVNWVKGPWEEEFGVELEIVSVSDDQT